MTYTHTALTDLSTRYYYVDITEADGTRIITAPIWYTRNDGIVPVIDDEDNRPIGELSAEEGGINVYPNPVQDWLHIYRTATSAQEGLWIMNTTGQVVYQDKMKVDESAKDISVKGWAKGIYIIRIGHT